MRITTVDIVSTKYYNDHLLLRVLINVTSRILRDPTIYCLSSQTFIVATKVNIIFTRTMVTVTVRENICFFIAISTSDWWLTRSHNVIYVQPIFFPKSTFWHNLVRIILYMSNYVLLNFSRDTKNCFLRNIGHLCEIKWLENV
jgi:hypothetical protein